MFLLKTIKSNAKKNTRKADCLKKAEINKRNKVEINFNGLLTPFLDRRKNINPDITNSIVSTLNSFK